MAVLKHILFFKLNLCKVITDIVLAVIMLMFALAFTFEQMFATFSPALAASQGERS